MNTSQAPAPNWPESLQWAVQFLPDYFTDVPCDFHVELMRALEDPRLRLIARVAPRGHAKSTCATLAYPLWCICERRRRNILIITHEASLARQFVRDLRGELESNELIVARYGAADDGSPRARRRGRAKWTEGKFTTAAGITVQAKGVAAGLRGTRVGPQRPDLIICDDIEKDERVATPEGRRKLEHWLRRVVMPALAPEGQLLVLGSMIHYDSLLAKLRDRQQFPGWDYKVYRALEARPGADGRGYLQALWPARWSVARLAEERRRIGTLAFEQEYMANPLDDALRVFRPEWLRGYDPAELERRPEQLVTLAAVDPATGAAGGDFFALWVGSLDLATGVLYTRQLTVERIGIVAQVSRIVTACERWRPVKVGIEAVAYQVALKQILDEHGRRRGLFLPVVALRTMANKRARIEGASIFFENGTFRLPAGLDPEVETQFLHFPKARHDDAPDVCAMGIELARTLRSAGRVDGATRPRCGLPRGGW